MDFQAYRRPLETVKAFKYFGRVLIASYYDWLAVFDILRKAWSRWEYRSRILGKEGADLWTSSNLYKAVSQTNLLFGSQTWVVNPRIGRTLGGFHHRMAHRLVIMYPKQNIVGR